MSNVFLILTLITMVAVLMIIGGGMFSMIRGGDFNKKYGNKLMRARVYLQGLALLFFVLALLTKETTTLS